MAVVSQGKLIAPSADARSKATLDSVMTESGLYKCSDSVNINGVTSSNWIVIAVSNEALSSTKCYAQIWIDATSRAAFLRTLNGSSYTAFITILTGLHYSTSTQAKAGTDNTHLMTPLRTKEAVTAYGVLSDGNTIIKVGGSQPAAQSGKTIIWIE